jgi:hypothetical protein
MKRSGFPDSLTPAGYMAKRVAQRPAGWLGEHVIDVYSLSGCMSEIFADYVKFWKHNGYWLFDSPETIEEVAREDAVDLAGATLFYYEVYPYQFDAGEKKWKLFEPEKSFRVNILIPAEKRLEGFDVVTFFAGSTPECLPLSCNDMAKSIHTNEHCLLESLEQAIEQLETGGFANCEPGPYRIFAVYTLPFSWPTSH